jgi:hypothetical protein
MGGPIRTLLIWFLVLAVPAQGAAAATMAFCGPNHHSSTASVQADPSAEHAHHASSSHHPQPHHATTAQTEIRDDASADAAAPTTFAQADEQKCSACASCCSFGAVPSAALAVPVPVIGPTLFSAVVPRVDAFAADGPDRPPRIVLA